MGVLSEGLDAALDVYEEVLRRPRFEAERVVRERDQALEELAQRRDNPVYLAMDALFRDVFGDHPYAWPFFGEPDEAAALTGEDCSAWYESLLVPENAVLAIVGDIDEARARDVAHRLLGDLPEGAVPAPQPAAAESPVTPGLHVLRKRDLQQSVTFVGYTAPPMLTDDAVALDVLNGILSGLGGRLFVELRDKRSLGYMTGSAFNSMKQRSLFFGYANPSAAGIDEAVDVIQAELEKVTRELVTDVEIERSKEWLIGTQLMRLQRNGSQASAYGTYEALGFGYAVVDRTPEMIQAVTRERIRDAASRVFVPENAVVVKLLPEE
jgi:zinc protease